MSTERIKPWVGYMSDEGSHGTLLIPVIRPSPVQAHTVPVCITPYLPDDPKAGEVWASTYMGSRRITGAPFDNDGVMYVSHHLGISSLESLTRIPATKTYRLEDVLDVDGFKFTFTIPAESKEAAAAQIVDSLIEEEG